MATETSRERKVIRAADLGHDDWLALVLSETSLLSVDSDWIRAERARCYAPVLTDPSRGYLYWASRHWRLIDKTTLRPMLLRPNAAQIDFLRRRGEENLILKARKLGFSTLIDSLYYWRCRTRPSQHAYVMAHTGDSADELWERIRYGHEHLPAFLRAPVDRSSKKELKFSDNWSHLRVLTAGSKGAGRAGDADMVHLSEFAQYPDAKRVLAAVGEARRPGSWQDIESTAYGLNEFHDRWVRTRAGLHSNVPHFYPWWWDPSLQAPAPGRLRLTAEERELRNLHKLSDEQITWRRLKSKELREDFPQEYAEDDSSCFLRSGFPKFDNPRLERLRNALLAADVTPGEGPREIPPGLAVWKRPRPGRAYIIGADVAEGLAHGANSVAAVLDAESGEQCAEWAGKIGPGEFARLVLAPLGRWYNTAELAPERNNHGHATIDALRMLPYPRIYRHRAYDQLRGRHRTLGWPTDGKTRPVMFSDLSEALREGYMTVWSPEFLAECLAFQAGDEEKDADDETVRAKGVLRDRVFAWGIAWQVRKQGRPVRAS